jgi:hypothetical protein
MWILESNGEFLQGTLCCAEENWIWSLTRHLQENGFG